MQTFYLSLQSVITLKECWRNILKIAWEIQYSGRLHFILLQQDATLSINPNKTLIQDCH